MPVEDALAFFHTQNGIKHHKSYPVVDDAGSVVSMVSRVDVLRWSQEGWLKEQTLGERPDVGEVFVGHTDELVGHLADRMASADVGRVPIVDRDTGKLVGLLARRDLLRVRAHAARLERERARPLTIPG
jgi:CBS domain-containing protein